MDRTLNVSDPQVLFHYPGDPNGLNYHHRLLVHKIGGGRWVCLSPDLELAVEDLNQRRHIVLGRNAEFPAHLIHECYTFDEVSKAELDRQKRLAKTMAAILDDSEVVDVAAMRWIISDPSSKRFGTLIPADSHGDIIPLGQHGLIDWDGDVHYVREIAANEVQAFTDRQKECANDIRTIGDHRDSQGRRFIQFGEATNLLRESKIEDWGFSGPRSVREFLRAVEAGPGDLTSYHAAWARSSGVTQASAICHEHQSLCESLRLGLIRDQLDISNSMAFGHLTRRIITLEIAVSRSPSAPDFSGLDLLVEAPVSASGAAHVATVNSWVTERLKERAQIQKQARLFKEEQAKKKGGGGGGDQEDEGKRWKKRQAKAKANPGGGAQGSAAGQ
eukprot:s2772_g3.t1